MASTTTVNKKRTSKRGNKDKLANLIGPIDPSQDAEARNNLVTARVGLLLKHSFFGNLATRLKLVNADEWLSTAATDGRNLYYNSRFVNLLQVKEVQFLLAHEVLHLVYDHLDRRGTRDPQMWNIAGDYCVNADLKKHSVGQFITTVPCLYDSKYAGKCAEEVYDDLMKNANMLDLADLIDQLLDEHMDEDGDQDQEDGKGPSKMSAIEREALREEIKENVIAAANAAKSAGHSLPENVSRIIQGITEPKMPWRELIQTVLTSTIKTDYSFMRPSRRGWHMDAILPSQTPGEEIEITVAIDTSGSISASELKIFLGEIQGIMDAFAGYKIHVISWDTGVHNPQDFTSENLDSIAEYTPGGGGGTDPNCIFNYLKMEGIVPNKLVVFTDGYFFGTTGDPDYCDTTFIIHKNEGFTSPFGTWAHYTD